jgi:hypothetical protein
VRANFLAAPKFQKVLEAFITTNILYFIHIFQFLITSHICTDYYCNTQEYHSSPSGYHYIQYVLTGETDKLMGLLLEGYDHILDVEDEENNHIFDVVQRRNQQETMAFLQSIPSFEVKLLFLFNRAKFSLILRLPSPST